MKYCRKKVRNLPGKHFNDVLVEAINLEIEIALRFGIWARSRFVPIVTEGVVSHVMIFSTDNTIRKKAELELASILQELENRVQERTKELFEKVQKYSGQH